MLEFIKKIFRNEGQETKEAHEISLHNLEDWIEERAKPLMEEVSQQTNDILMKVNEELERARLNVEVLENAKLQNPNIPFKAKQYMEGNRKAYLRSIISFLGRIEINNKDYFYLLEFCKEFDSIMDELNKSTLRSYTILQEFFANESGKIAENLKNFDLLFKELRNLLNSDKLDLANKAREKSEMLRAKYRQKLNIGVDFKDIEAGLKLAKNEKESIMAEIMNFSQGEDHGNFISLNEERKNKEKEFFGQQDAILQSFSVLERPLRKYSHIAFEDEEIVLEYLKNPIEALSNDAGLRIAGILKNLGKMLDDSQIQVDEKKKDRALEELAKLGWDYFESFKKRYFSFKSEIEEMDNKIKATKVADKMKEFNKKLEDSNSRIEKNALEYEKLKNEFEKVNNSIEGLKSEIQNSVREMFNEEVRIST
ncbi:hypothetical protein HY637_05305 [Candidatus Woesearchaeota archaeon]|nr:hypothetical protein [Candidatus Woesearchaeota archaeon]